METVALVIIYNHRFDRNIEIVEKIYKNRFNHIFHLVPFYDGNRPNVIPVYDSSYYFEGYIAQGFRSFYDSKFQHYLFIGDDLILNPLINQDNYQTHFHLNKKSSFFPEFTSLHHASIHWTRLKEAFAYTPQPRGLEIMKEIPDWEKAVSLLQRNGLAIHPSKYGSLARTKWDRMRSKIGCKNFLFWLKHSLKKLICYDYKLKYPLIGGYSDIFIVSSEDLPVFQHYCGAFAASGLFAELAIPTALALVSGQIVTYSDMQLQGRALWTKSDFKVLLPYQNNLNLLLDNFPENYLFLHPIKLSKWDTAGI